MTPCSSSSALSRRVREETSIVADERSHGLRDSHASHIIMNGDGGAAIHLVARWRGYVRACRSNPTASEVF